MADQTGQPRYYLERGYRKLELMRAIALGELTGTELAERYECSKQAISDFGQRHRHDIQYIRDHIEDEFAGLWTAAKRNRIAEYQSEVIMLNGQIDRHLALAREMSATDTLPANDESITRLMKARDRALRSIAEELGALPTRVQVAVTAPVKHIIEIDGMQPGDLT